MCLLAERLVKQTTEFMKKNIQRDDNNKNKSSKTSACYCAVRREASLTSRRGDGPMTLLGSSCYVVESCRNTS